MFHYSANIEWAEKAVDNNVVSQHTLFGRKMLILLDKLFAVLHTSCQLKLKFRLKFQVRRFECALFFLLIRIDVCTLVRGL